EPTVDATHAYLRAWPNGAHAAQARDWLIARGIVPPGAAPTPPAAGDGAAGSPSASEDERAFVEADRRGTVAAYRAYLDAFPQGRFAALARQHLERLGASGDR
ncbi:MAG: hypothetical protein KJZ59_01895, partial [Pararhodobacter sp.]|nr:hypothetical protein [Pararhodobacter sp.]